jgi:hypothetical protein
MLRRIVHLIKDVLKLAGFVFRHPGSTRGSDVIAQVDRHIDDILPL